MICIVYWQLNAWLSTACTSTYAQMLNNTEMMICNVSDARWRSSPATALVGLQSSVLQPSSASLNVQHWSCRLVRLRPADAHNNDVRAAMTAETSTPEVPTARVLDPLDFPNELPPLLVETVPLLTLLSLPVRAANPTAVGLYRKAE
jgi:hypothetical protein